MQPAVHADRLERAIERKGVQDRSPIVHLDTIGGEVQTVRQSHTYHRQWPQSLPLTQFHVTAGEVFAGRDRHFPRRSRRIDLPSVSRRNSTLERRNDAGDFASRITNGPPSPLLRFDMSSNSLSFLETWLVPRYNKV